MDAWLLFLAVALIVTGSLNTITTKFADLQFAVGIDGTRRQFDHPFFQAAGMFLGELLCLFAFYSYGAYKRCTNRPADKAGAKFNPFLFVIPACCDLTATSCMYVGLNWTYASVFQMLRGSVIIFTGIMSVLFLGRKLKLLHWAGMLLVLIGLVLVGAASYLQPVDHSANAPPHVMWGNIIVIAAQLVVSIQMVVEEKLIGKYDVPPLQVVGFEGLFGFVILSCLLVVFYWIPGPAVGHRLENTPDAFSQMGHNGIIVLCTLGNMLSIAFFNFFGVSITQYGSATTRMVLDSVRTVVIWGFSLIPGINWQQFQWLQLVGFAFLLLGSAIYNEIIVLRFLGPHFIPDPKKKTDVEDPLVSPTEQSRLLANGVQPAQDHYNVYTNDQPYQKSSIQANE